MKVLKPNGIFQALYAEFRITDKESEKNNKPSKALYFSNFFRFY